MGGGGIIILSVWGIYKKKKPRPSYFLPIARNSKKTMTQSMIETWNVNLQNNGNQYLPKLFLIVN